MNLFDSTKPEFVDIHTHILPYVDDGAEDFEDATDMLMEEYNQGTKVVIMTPHFRTGMFDTPGRKVLQQFNRLENWLSSSGYTDMKMLLTREYYCDERFEALLDGFISGLDKIDYQGNSYSPEEEIIPFGVSKCILIELPYNASGFELYEKFIKKTVGAGLTPIIAHAERYSIVQDTPELAAEMIQIGAFIQINSINILDKRNSIEYQTANALVQNGLVNFVASDAHDMKKRSPNLKQCYLYFRRKYGKETTEKLFRHNAMFFIND